MDAWGPNHSTILQKPNTIYHYWPSTHLVEEVVRWIEWSDSDCYEHYLVPCTFFACVLARILLSTFGSYVLYVSCFLKAPSRLKSPERTQPIAHLAGSCHLWIPIQFLLLRKSIQIQHSSSPFSNIENAAGKFTRSIIIEWKIASHVHYSRGRATKKKEQSSVRTSVTLSAWRWTVRILHFIHDSHITASTTLCHTRWTTYAQRVHSTCKVHVSQPFKITEFDKAEKEQPSSSSFERYDDLRIIIRRILEDEGEH